MRGVGYRKSEIKQQKSNGLEIYIIEYNRDVHIRENTIIKLGRSVQRSTEWSLKFSHISAGAD